MESHERQQFLSFVVRSSDDAVLRANLPASPCLSSHEVIAVRSAPSAADGLSMGITRAAHELVVCVHQDVYLPARWDRLALGQYRMAERQSGPIGVAGVYGVGPAADGPDGPAARRIGWVEDRGRVLSEGSGLPARVTTLDEVVLIVRKDTPLRFDPEPGFHLYGADLCLQARERGLAVVALGAPCRHNSRIVGLPEAFFPSAEVFARKWAHRLPVATPCVVIDRDGRLVVDATLKTIASRRVGYRPNRVEPRAKPRRPKLHRLLKEPRRVARKCLMATT